MNERSLNDSQSELTEVGVSYRGVDSSVNSGKGGGSVGHGLGSHGGGVACRQTVLDNYTLLL